MWLDCDVGHDDAMALILSAYSPYLKLLGVSSVYGNSSVENTTANAIRVIQAAGIKGVKVYKGAAKPLVKTRVYASDIHGSSGLDGTDLLPEADMTTYLAQDENAVNAMRRAIMSSPEPVSIAAVGPLTNIALLVSLYPEVFPQIKTLAIMGGSMGIGNTTCAAEFNIYSDPEAAHIVIHSGIKEIALIPLDVTHTVLATKQIISRIQDEIDVPQFNCLVTDLLLYFGSTYEDVFGEKEGAPLHDPVAVAYLFMRPMFTERHIRIDIDCNDSHGRGRTFCDVYKKTNEPANCWIVTSVELEPFWKQMVDALVRASKNSPLADID
ncbi:Uridine nucleosidase 1 [Coemansia sp. RSA 2607]|nr:Uridine nucleosidase 1 [Coemansia sp. RSA 2607]